MIIPELILGSVVACVGDSITEGFGVSDKSLESYPSKLQQIMGPEVTVINFGGSYVYYSTILAIV